MALPRFIREESGVALLEFALFTTLLLLLVFGAIDFGRALFTANNLTSAAREGARYGAALAIPDTGLIRTRVLSSYSRFGNDSLLRSEVAINCPPAGAACVGGMQQIEVTISHPFTWTNLIVPALMGQTMRDTLHAKATFRWESAP